MATLVLTALGTAVGGPLGGAAGAILGQQLDHSMATPAANGGSRLQDLTATTSAYGQPIARHFGQVRSTGTIIWATDLIEQSETLGGGKGRPSTTGYSYAASLAVALSSRPIVGLGRIWADGHLLRGAAGDLKVAGALRVYRGHGDQQPDPLIAADIGPACPAFRGLAYCVFEGLQLASFGNRIPALTFEVIADQGDVSLAEMVAPTGANAIRPLQGLSGWSDGGGGLSGQLTEFDALYPLSYRLGDRLEIAAHGQDATLVLPEAAVIDRAAGDEGLIVTGQARRTATAAMPAGIRYFDRARDYQIGTQLGTGALPGSHALLDFPGVLDAGNARLLASRLAQCARARSVRASWRSAELDPAIVPGAIVRMPGRTGDWLVESWELDAHGVALELSQVPTMLTHGVTADAGSALPQPDLVGGSTILAALELPPASVGVSAWQIHAAVSSESVGWAGATLYGEQDGNLVLAGHAQRPRSTVGRLVTPLPPSPGVLLERGAELEVAIPADLWLGSVAADALAGGANRAMIGDEVVQFVTASRLEAGRWRLRGLLRGRGGTERAAGSGHAAGSRFVLLDDTLVPMDMSRMATGADMQVAAIGLLDDEPVMAGLANVQGSVRPLAPVHARKRRLVDGGLAFSWTRRVSGAWEWPDMPGIATPQRYQIGIGTGGTAASSWLVEEPRLELTAAMLAELSARYAGQPLWLREVGGDVLSDPVPLMIL
ncbi:hypothetical protein PK98_11110 [Croceibacterium mercuriale]|uniref:Uncharacterized protein n=1 Tax=Croceibacterium mercuriale TaxID=1572751 RepID=A0A0B2BXX4_9SPHN|nr:phage tail protein [Croceibacterium mercuriale]KHL24536.1 hypothetical protein PK98_11110 [Croceibacterium mercuriale]